MSNEEAIKNGWSICPKCKEIYAGLVDSGLCWECDLLQKNPNAKKLFCKDCTHFRHHAVYDENDKSECSCRKHLTFKTLESYIYECDDFNAQQSLEEEA